MGSQHQPGIPGKVLHLDRDLPPLREPGFLTGDPLVQKQAHPAVTLGNRRLVEGGKGLPVGGNDRSKRLRHLLPGILAVFQPEHPEDIRLHVGIPQRRLQAAQAQIVLVGVPVAVHGYALAGHLTGQPGKYPLPRHEFVDHGTDTRKNIHRSVRLEQSGELAGIFGSEPGA